MKSFFTLAFLAAAATAIPAPQATHTDSNTTLLAKNTATTTTVCEGNTADNRTKWCDDSIDTDWYNYVPNTGVVREVCGHQINSRAMLTIPSTGLTLPT